VPASLHLLILSRNLCRNSLAIELFFFDFRQARAKRIYNHESWLHLADHFPNVAAVFSPVSWRIIHAPKKQIFWNTGKSEIDDHPLQHGFELSHAVLKVEVHD